MCKCSRLYVNIVYSPLLFILVPLLTNEI
uniref:Uncharacterized protein n=1 Tax=Anguilla anguilla TaxID=7936 RepID=A0A0E9QDH3_ANGAN